MKRSQRRRTKASRGHIPTASRRWLICLSAAVLLALIVAALLITKGKPVYVMSVNGEPVDRREYMLILNRHQSQVYNYFYLKYGMQDNPGFWTMAYGGEVPLDKLKQDTLEELVSVKVQQIAAQQHGVVVGITPEGPFLPADPSYTVFLDRLQQENIRRQEAVKRGEAIYGPTQYNDDNFYRYLFSRTVQEFKSKLSEEWTPGDEILKAFYETKKDAQYKRADTVELQSVCWPYAGSNGVITEASKQDAKSGMEEVRARLVAGESIEAVVQGYPVQYTQGILDDQTAYEDLKYRPTLTAEAAIVSVGTISETFESDQGDAQCLIQVTSRQSAGYRPFEEVRSQVVELYVDEKYQAWVDQMVREAVVKFNAGVYNRIEPQ